MLFISQGCSSYLAMLCLDSVLSPVPAGLFYFQWQTIATMVTQRTEKLMKPMIANCTDFGNPCIASTIFANPASGLNNCMLLISLEAY